MKKLFLSIALAGAVAATLAVAGCSDNTSENVNLAKLSSAEAAYAFSAASAGMIISAEDGAADDPAQQPQTHPETTQPPRDDAEAVQPPQEVTGEESAYDALDGYMTLAESMLRDGAFGVAEGASERAEYEYKTVVTYSDVHGNAHSYEMHYNKTLIPDYDDDDDDDDDEIEEEYAIRGVMVIEGKDYAIRGEREYESERGESETETEFRVELGEGAFMLVEQSEEYERGESEQEYSYSVWQNGRCIERSSFEYESEHSETEVKMTAMSDGVTQAFYLTKESVRGREVMILRVGTGRDAKSYYVTQSTDADGEISYSYEQISRR